MKTYKFDRFIFKANSINDAINVAKKLQSRQAKTVKDEASNYDTINALIKDEFSAIDAYNVAIKNLTGKLSNESIQVLELIRDEELKHVENLQAIVNNNVTEKNLEDSMKDDRLAPMTYKKLKELGVNRETYSKWTQEQANEYIRNKSEKKTSKEKGQKEEIDKAELNQKMSNGLKEFESKFKNRSFKWGPYSTSYNRRDLLSEKDIDKKQLDVLNAIVDKIGQNVDGDVINGLEGGVQTLSKIAYVAELFGFKSMSLEKNQTHTGKYGIAFFK